MRGYDTVMNPFNKFFDKKNHKLLIIISIALIIWGAVSLVMDASKFEKLTEANQLESNATYSVNAKNVQRIASDITSAELADLQIPNFEYSGEYELYSFKLGDDDLLILSAVSVKQALKTLSGHMLVLERKSSASLNNFVSTQESVNGKSYGNYVLWLEPASIVSSFFNICAIIIGGLLLLCVLLTKWVNRQKELLDTNTTTVNGIKIRGLPGGGNITRR